MVGSAPTPSSNFFCVALDRIREEKDDERLDGLAGVAWDELTPEQLPPCKAGGGLSQARHQLGDVLRIQGSVRRHGCVGGTAAEGARRREQQAEEALGRGNARRCDPEGCRRKRMVAPDAKREAVAHVVAIHGVSQRRACEVLAVDRSGVRYRSIRPDDAVARAAMKAVAAERRRFGYPPAGNGLPANRERRRIHIMLERQGIVMNLKKLRRLYREERLQVRKRGGRKRALGTRRPMVLPGAANERWSLDFISDALTDGRRFRVLAVVDDFTRECLTLIADTSLSGTRVVRELDAVIARRGRPMTIVSDNGTEFTSTVCGRAGVRRQGCRPSRPCPAGPSLLAWRARAFIRRVGQWCNDAIDRRIDTEGHSCVCRKRRPRRPNPGRSSSQTT